MAGSDTHTVKLKADELAHGVRRGKTPTHGRSFCGEGFDRGEQWTT